MSEERKEQAMNRLICLLLTLMILLGTLSACAAEPDPEPTEALTYTIVEVVDSHYIPPNTYEICYRTTFANGIIIDCWKTVDREEYEREVGE